MKRIGLLAALASVGLGFGFGHGGFDFGAFRDHLLDAKSVQLFGVVKPVAASSQLSLDASVVERDPRKVVTLAKHLRVRTVSAAANLGANIDMMTLWPDDIAPTHIIACNEQGTSQPGVQRIDLATGSVETLLTGTSSCDPAHRTPWGTVLVAEEAGSSGWALEIRDPLHTTGVSFDRATGTLSGADAGNVAVRPALGHLSFEGVGILPNGVVYYGDENRPSQGTPGGAYFKFVPSAPWAGGPPIADLADSPLADGQVYGLRLGLRSGATDYGQGTETGLGAWIAVPSSYGASLRAAAASLALTGYYRPEDLALDLAELARGNVRFCANNTGNEEDDLSYGNTICVTDGTLDEALGNLVAPEVQLLVVGTPQLAMMDNMAYQPGRGNWILHEDGDQLQGNNDLWSCLDDGADDDLLSDGCVRVGTLNDLSAEWTGGLFDAFGRRFFVSVQHNVTGHGIVLEISGWR